MYARKHPIHFRKVKVARLCPTLYNPVDYTVLGILQARILEWVAIPFSRRSSQARDRTQVSRIAGGFFTSWATREARGPLMVGLVLWVSSFVLIGNDIFWFRK